MHRSDAIRCVLQEKGRDVFTTTPETTVYDALARMAERSVGALIVMNAGVLVGVVSERDYARKVILQGRSSRESDVASIMEGDVMTVTEAHTVEDCMRIMTERHIRHLPVLDAAGKLAGIISMGDLVKYIISAQRDEIQALHAYISASC